MQAPVTTRLPARRCAAGATAAPWVTKHGTAPGGSSSRQRVRCMASSTRSRTTSQSEAHRTVVERRAVDVVVLGAGPLAAAAAYSLARRGKKVCTASQHAACHASGWSCACSINYVWRVTVCPHHLPGWFRYAELTMLTASPQCAAAMPGLIYVIPSR